jgi:iron complex transport system substrate-binding protein
VRLSALFAALLFAALAVAGCGGAERGPAEPAGIIVMGPHLTEVVFALGQGGRVVGVGNYSDYPPEIEGVPRVGGYIDPDLEKITLLNPAMILLAGVYPKVSEFAKTRGMRVVNIDMDSLESIDTGIATVGELLDCEAESDAMRAQFQKELDQLRADTAGLPRPRVLIITGRSTHTLDTLQTAGGPSFLSDIVTLAGGDNVYADTATRYFEASKETVVMRAPEVIVEFHAGETLTEAQEAAFIRDWGALPSLPAVKNNRIYLITESHSMRPGPRIVEIARKIAHLLHPSAVAAP